MKKIMVFNVPAEEGGSLTILNQYYQAAVKDKNNEWIFVVSLPELAETDNVKVLKYPWIKKSWFHRLYFDKFIACKLVSKYKVDEVLSLQNIIIPNINVKQSLYVHQSLPFVEKRYGLFENFIFWVYQNIIGRMIIKSIKKADKVIVQTKWLMNVAAKKANIDTNKFIIEQPKMNITVKKYYESNNNPNNLFFYPASAYVYKNHEIILNTCKLLVDRGIDNFSIIFTLSGDENSHANKIKNIAVKDNLPIIFAGQMYIDSVYEYYSKSILIFPSYIETYGLPLLEAKIHNTPILASDCPFSHEILDDYNKVQFFDPHNENELLNLMLELLT